MGLTCKPTGKLRSDLKKLQNEQEKMMKDKAKRPEKAKKVKE